MNNQLSGNTLELSAVLALLETMNKSTDDYIFLWELAKERVWFPGAIDEQFPLKKTEDSYYGLTDILEITYPNDRMAVYTDLYRVADGYTDFHDMEYRWIDKTGKVIWISCRGNVHRDANGVPVYVLGRVSDTALKHKVDGTTGIFNKVKLESELEAFLSSEAAGAMMMIGIDNFKNINIQHGREYGDQILRKTAEVMEAATGNSMKNYRLDGDCFAVLLEMDSQEEIHKIFDDIQKGMKGLCTLSAGVVMKKELPVRNIRIAYQYVEQTLDTAKKNGKNRIQFFLEEDYNRKISEIELLEELKASIQNDCTGFSLVYQPQIKIKTHQLYGAEVLLRYQSAARGVIQPEVFIPLLEESGLICQAGMWTLKQALEDCRMWREKVPEFCVSVNLSYVQLKEPGIAEQVLEILKESGLPGNALTLEVTESMQLQDFSLYNRIFAKWKRAGIIVSVDDFGTGYSSLSYLKHLKIDQIKIDRCFVQGIQFSSYNYRLIRNLMSLASDLQIQILFEGVEKKEELSVLEGLDVNLVQGHLFSRPCSRERFYQKYIQKSETGIVFPWINTENSGESREKQAGLWNGRGEAEITDCQIKDFEDFQYEEILSATDLGLWIIRLNQESGEGELFADQTMRRVLAADADMTPGECFMHWYTHINNGYYKYVHQNFTEMIQSEKLIQLQYSWEHPLLGDVIVRSIGIRDRDEDGKIVLKGYHRIVDDLVETRFLSEEPTVEIFEFNQERSTIYFHTGRKLLDGEDLRERDFPACWIENQIVHQKFAVEFAGLFTDVHQKEDVEGMELLLRTKQGEYSWVKISVRHLSEEEYDRNTVLVQVELADHEIMMLRKNLWLNEYYRADHTKMAPFYYSTENTHSFLSESQEELVRIMNQVMPNGIVGTYINDDYPVYVINDRLLQMLGYTYEELMDATGGLFVQVIHPDDRYMVNRLIEKALDSGDDYTAEYRICRKDGSSFWVFDMGHRITTADGRDALLCVLTDVSESMSEKERFKNDAYRDYLTGLYNRRYITQASDAVMERGVPHTGVLLDIDNFKAVNDMYGHPTGDKVLCYLSDLLLNSFRDMDFCGRIGGDEFFVLLPNIMTEESICKKAQAIIEQFEEYVQSLCPEAKSGVSIAVLSGDQKTSFDKLFERVDKLLYQVKNTCKGSVLFQKE